MNDLWPGFKTPPTDPSRDIRPTVPARRPRAPERPQDAPPFSRETYRTECEKRWDGPALRDARGNWEHWQEHHEALEEAMRKFKRDPMQEDMAGKFHNPTGRLTDFLWILQTAWKESGLAPLLDFCEHYQRVHLRRGLLIYCTMILREIERPQPEESAGLIAGTPEQ